MVLSAVCPKILRSFRGFSFLRLILRRSFLPHFGGKTIISKFLGLVKMMFHVKQSRRTFSRGSQWEQYRTREKLFPHPRAKLSRLCHRGGLLRLRARGSQELERVPEKGRRPSPALFHSVGCCLRQIPERRVNSQDEETGNLHGVQEFAYSGQLDKIVWRGHI